MSKPSPGDILMKNKLRICQVNKWEDGIPNGFQLEPADSPPHVISMVESNSPAAFAGLRFQDAILEVATKDTTKYDYEKLRSFIGEQTKKSPKSITFLVMEKKKYEDLKKQGVKIDKKFAELIIGPTSPPDLRGFQKNTPRTCVVVRSGASMGFELVGGSNNVGGYIQDVAPDSPAATAGLRKCDRILEINDEFVDEMPYNALSDKVRAAAQGGQVKFYVLDTAGYKHFKQNNIDLRSSSNPSNKEIAQTRPAGAVISDSDDDMPDDSGSSPPTPAPNNIRICTVRKTDPAESYGFSISYDDVSRYHKMKITSNPDGTPTRAQLAGVANGDCLIEVNNENVEKLQHDDVKRRIGAVRYPEPLVLLVADAATANHYRSRGIPITSRMAGSTGRQTPSYSRQPEIDPGRGISALIGTSTRPPRSTDVSRQPSPEPMTRPVPGVASPIDTDGSRYSTTDRGISAGLVPNQLTYTLRSEPGVTGFGFSLNSKDPEGTPHRIIDVKPSSVAAKQGLQNDDYLISINEQNVTRMSRAQALQAMKEAAGKEKQGTPIKLVVTRGRAPPAPSSYLEPDDPPLPVSVRPARTPTPSPPRRATPPLLRPRPDFTPPRDRITPSPPPEDDGKYTHSEGKKYTIKTWRRNDNLGLKVEHIPGKSMDEPQVFLIEDVEEDTPADTANVMSNRYLTEINGRPINATDKSQLMRELRRAYEEKNALTLTVATKSEMESFRRANVADHDYTRPRPVTTDRGPLSGSSQDNATHIQSEGRKYTIKTWGKNDDLGLKVEHIPGKSMDEPQVFLIEDIEEDTPADTANVMPNRYLTEINGRPINATDKSQLMRELRRAYEEKNGVTLTVATKSDMESFRKANKEYSEFLTNAGRKIVIREPEFEPNPGLEIRLVDAGDGGKPLVQISRINRDSAAAKVGLRVDDCIVAIDNKPIKEDSESEIMKNIQDSYARNRTIQLTVIDKDALLAQRKKKKNPNTQNGSVSPSDGTNYGKVSDVENSSGSLGSKNLTRLRTGYDIVSDKSVSREVRIRHDLSSNLGFHIASEYGHHIIRDVDKNSEAAKAGLTNGDELLTINNRVVVGYNHLDLVRMIEREKQSQFITLTVLPKDVQPYQSTSLQQTNGTVGHGSTYSSINGQNPQILERNRENVLRDLTEFETTSRLLNLPSNPYPRQCIVRRDNNNQECGFQVLEKDNCDTPIIVEVLPDSPAKRSGLASGDHILFIDGINVQSIREFRERQNLIRQGFEKNGEIKLIVLTSAGYRVLQARGGILSSPLFNSQAKYVQEMQPRLYDLQLDRNEQTFGFTLHQDNPSIIRQVRPGSKADLCGIERDDIILEINGEEVASMQPNRVLQLIRNGEQDGRLWLLVIDPQGYHFSVDHALPISSSSSFVRTIVTRGNDRTYRPGVPL